MADISAEITAFRNAVYGEDVRSAMISLANKINNESSSAATTVLALETDLYNKTIIPYTQRDPETNFVKSVESGYVRASDGTIISNATLVHTDYIPLIEGETYYARNVNPTYNAYYDENKNYVNVAAIVEQDKFTVPQGRGIAYGRFTFHTASAAQSGYIYINDHKPSI